MPLSEAIIKELLETGKTKEKVTGFNSKAGNVFDSCLKYEDERISFDFDNPGSLSLQKQESEEQSEVQMAVRKMRRKKKRRNRHQMVQMISMPLWRMKLRHFRNRKKRQNGSLEVIF